MSLLQRASQAINTVVEKVLMVIGAAICLILFAQVASRYAGASLGWSEEVSRHLLVAITFMGGTVAYKRASFIGLKGFGHSLGPAVQQIIVVGAAGPDPGLLRPHRRVRGHLHPESRRAHLGLPADPDVDPLFSDPGRRRHLRRSRAGGYGPDP